MPNAVTVVPAVTPAPYILCPKTIFAVPEIALTVRVVLSVITPVDCVSVTFPPPKSTAPLAGKLTFVVVTKSGTVKAPVDALNVSPLLVAGDKFPVCDVPTSGQHVVSVPASMTDTVAALPLMLV